MSRPVAGLVAAAAISNLGSGMTMLAVPWFVLESTGRGTDTGLVVMAETVGLLAGSGGGGPWLDRLGPRAAAMLFDLAAGAVVASIPALHHLGLLPLWLLGVLALGLGLSRAPGNSARQVLIPDIAHRQGVPVERVTTAYDSPAQGARALGPPLAGVVISAVGAPAALLLDAASFAVSALITRRTLDEVTTGAGQGGGYLKRLAEGFRFLRRDRTLFAILAMVAVTNGVNAGFFSVLVPMYGQRFLHSPVAVGLVFAATGAGMLVGSVGFSWLGLGWRRWPVLVVCYLLVLGPRAGVFLLQPAAVVLIVVSGVLMLAFGPLNPILGAVKAERTPTELRARVFSAIDAAALAFMPVGTLVAGVLTDHLGLLSVLAVFAAVSGVMSLCPLVFPAWRAVERPVRTASPEGDQPAPQKP